MAGDTPGTAAVEYPLALRLLDHQVDGPDGDALVKVDDVELEMTDAGPVAIALLCGPGALGERLPGRIGRWTTDVWRRLSDDRAPMPIRIPLMEVQTIGSAITVTAEAAQAVQRRLSLERWLRIHLIERLPGSGAVPAASPPLRSSAELERPAGTGPVFALSDLLGMPADIDGAEVGTVHEVIVERDNPRAPVVGPMRVTGYVVGRRNTGSTLGYDHDSEHGPWALRTAMKAWHRSDLHIAHEDVEDFDPVRRRVTARAGRKE